MHHSSQQLPSTVIKGVYKISMPNNVIGTFWFFVSDLVGRAKNKTWHKQLLSDGYTHQWKQSS